MVAGAVELFACSHRAVDGASRRRRECRGAAQVAFTRIVAHRRPVAVARTDFVRPSAPEIWLHRVEVAAAIVRISARDVSELIRRSYVVERPRAGASLLVVRAVVAVVEVTV